MDHAKSAESVQGWSLWSRHEWNWECLHDPPLGKRSKRSASLSSCKKNYSPMLSGQSRARRVCWSPQHAGSAGLRRHGGVVRSRSITSAVPSLFLHSSRFGVTLRETPSLTLPRSWHVMVNSQVSNAYAQLVQL